MVTYNDMPGFIGFCEESPTISVPRIIRALLSHDKLNCSNGPNQLSFDPIWLKPGDYPSSFQDVVFNPSREIPIIYISPRRAESADGSGESEKGEMLINPFKTAFVKDIFIQTLYILVEDLNNQDHARQIRTPDQSVGRFGLSGILLIRIEAGPAWNGLASLNSSEAYRSDGRYASLLFCVVLKGKHPGMPPYGYSSRFSSSAMISFWRS